MLACSRMLPSRPLTFRSRDRCSSRGANFSTGGGTRGTCPALDFAVIRSARLAGRSQGAVSLSCSRAVAREIEGFHWRGGVITTERGVAGASATIMAVWARKSCSVANVVASVAAWPGPAWAVPPWAVPPCPVPPRAWAAVGRPARTWLRLASARATLRRPSTPSRALVIALGVYAAGVLGGIRELLRITVRQPPAPILPRTP